MRSFFVSFLVIISFAVSAQPGSITIIQDPGVQHVVDLYRTFANSKRMADGYRIQLGSNSNRQMLMNLKAKFLSEYPQVASYILYQQPQFKLRIGDFRTREEANLFLEEIKSSFPGFVVQDKIFAVMEEW